jgi:hypothetical protein
MKPQDLRIAALRRFATAITLLTIIGHTFLGFEQSWAYPIVALITGYLAAFILETVEAWVQKRPPWYAGGVVPFINFMLPAHISAQACAMLLYANEQLWPIVFAVIVTNCSKYIFQLRVGDRIKHFLNPSNTGISITLLLFPWVGIAPPYQFTENISGIGNWMLPLLFICIGTFLNARFTKKMPLIFAWLGGFILQAVLRSWWFGTPVLAALNPMTGVAFLLFTFYMVEDPGTTPFKTSGQIAFGLSVAAVYALLVLNHVVFGLFFSLFIVCILRGLMLWASSLAIAPATSAIERKGV